MKILILVLTMNFCCSIIVCAQDFIFQLVVDNLQGAYDTVRIGYDAMATDTVDVIYGELDISAIPKDSALSARVSNLNHPFFNQNGIPEKELQDNSSIKTKIFVNPGNCSPISSTSRSVLSIYSDVWPIRLTWNTSNFDTLCVVASVISDWHPFLRPDVYLDDIQQVNLRDTGSFILNKPIHYYLDIDQDTIFVVFTDLTGAIIDKVKELGQPLENYIDISPNPIIDRAQVSFYLKKEEYTNEKYNFYIYDLSGELVLHKTLNITHKGKVTFEIQKNNLTSGLYFYEIVSNKELLGRGKIVVR